MSGRSTDAAAGAGLPVPPRRRGMRSALLRLFAIQELGVLVAGIIIGAVFAFLSPEFLTAASAGSILASAVQFGIVGLGVTVLMIAGEFDLSVASVYSLCPLVMASLWMDHDVNVFLALALALLLALGDRPDQRLGDPAPRQFLRSSSRSPPRSSGPASASTSPAATRSPTSATRR